MQINNQLNANSEQASKNIKFIKNNVSDKLSKMNRQSQKLEIYEPQYIKSKTLKSQQRDVQSRIIFTRPEYNRTNATKAQELSNHASMIPFAKGAKAKLVSDTLSQIGQVLAKNKYFREQNQKQIKKLESMQFRSKQLQYKIQAQSRMSTDEDASIEHLINKLEIIVSKDKNAHQLAIQLKEQYQRIKQFLQ